MTTDWDDDVRCGDKHPALPLPGSGLGLVIHGGRASSPNVVDASIYIGFDRDMRVTDRAFPWTPGHEFLFRIADGCKPTNKHDFRSLVEWTKGQLEAGHKVHCGCIGGHGRTGMFLAALVSLYGEKDAIGYVRKHYCHRAVETSEQVRFLVDEYGVAPAKGSYAAERGNLSNAITNYDVARRPKRKKPILVKAQPLEPLRNVGSMWDYPLQKVE